MTNIFENNDIVIYETIDNDFVVGNKKEKDVKYYLDGLDDFLEIDKNNTIYLFEGLYTECIIDCLMNENYKEVM